VALWFSMIATDTVGFALWPIAGKNAIVVPP
jgi:hypothetical protein